MNQRFPNDHPIEGLHGMVRLSPCDIRKIFAKRAAYVQEKMSQRAVLGEPISFYADELAAIAQVMEVYEEHQQERRFPFDLLSWKRLLALEEATKNLPMLGALPYADLRREVVEALRRKAMQRDKVENTTFYSKMLDSIRVA